MNMAIPVISQGFTAKVGSLKMNTALEYSTRAVHGRGAVDVKRVLLTI
jgi:hypothetical protein